jgi:hypothetical protein
MRRSKRNLLDANKKQSLGSRLLISERMSAEDYLRNRSFGHHKQDTKQEEAGSEEENSPLRMKKNATHDVTNQNLPQNVSGMGNIVEEESKIRHYEGEEAGSESEYESASEELERPVQEEDSEMLDYFYTLDSSHKDFVRSMIQTNNGSTIITASEDKSIKMFTIYSG